MSISKFNSEGYYDPTAYEALTAVEQSEKAKNTFRPMVYICSPYSGDVETNTLGNQTLQQICGRYGLYPYRAAFAVYQFIDDSLPAERELGMFFEYVLMSKCTEVWVFGSKISDGMKAEIKTAKWRNCRIRYFNENCEEVYDRA